MSLKAGFSEIDITPPPGIHKIGWLKDIVSDHVLDPLFARAAVFDSAGESIGFVQLDTLFVPADQVAEIRERISAQHAFPGQNVMVAATHNHAGPAVADVGDVKHDPAYTASLIEKVVRLFGEARANLQDAEVGFARSFEFGVSHNRRVVMRDGTVKTHGTFSDPEALYVEGPVDPEVAVLAARAGGGKLLGALVNFACHPTDHGPDTALSAGFPGVLAGEMKARGCPVTPFLQGAAGNVSCPDPARGNAAKGMQEVGKMLAEDVAAALGRITFTSQVRVGARSKTVQLPFRRLTPEQLNGTAPGAQRFIDSAIYERAIPAEVERIRRLGTEAAEVQVLFVNETAFAAIPAEYFVEYGLQIKQQAYPRQAVVVSLANGRGGYVPTKEAFQRGGYETTFGPSSCLGPEAGGMLADAAVELIGRGIPS